MLYFLPNVPYQDQLYLARRLIVFSWDSELIRLANLAGHPVVDFGDDLDEPAIARLAETFATDVVPLRAPPATCTFHVIYQNTPDSEPPSLTDLLIPDPDKFWV
jgi:hypothetical protein